MASSKIENTSYDCVQLNWNRKKAKSVFTDLKEIAQDYEWGVDEDREFYYRAISTAITERYWVGKGVTFFEPRQEVEPIVNEYDVLVPQMNSGNNYLLTVKDDGGGSSQELYGIRKDNLVLNQAILGFGSELATGITPTTNPVAGTPANMTDGNTATEWDSGTNQLTSHYIDIDLGALKSYIGKIRVDSSSATDKDTTFADRFKILISADGNFAGEETQVYASTEDLGTADMVVIFVPTTGRYIRIQITQNKAAHWHVDEVEVYEWNVADITRWATEKMNKRKDPVRRGVLGLDTCTKRLWPRGKIRVTSKDGTSYYDYPHIGTNIHIGANLKLQARLELGEMAPSIGDELLTQRRMLAEYSIAGLARDSDLSSGSALQGGTITHTHIGKDSIETPMLKALSIIAAKIAAGAIDTEHLAADAVVAAKIDALTITAAEIAVGTLTYNELHANAATQYSDVYVQADTTTTSTSFVDISSMSITITTISDSVVFLIFTFGSWGTGNSPDDSNACQCRFRYDGSEIANTKVPMRNPGYGLNQCVQGFQAMSSAGSHTFKVQWKSNGSPAQTMHCYERHFTAIELRR